MIGTYRRGSTWEYFAVALAVVVLVVNGASIAKPPALLPSGTWLALLTIAPLSFFMWRGLWDRRPVLRLTESEIWFAGWSADSAVPLSDVEDVREYTAAKGEPWIALHLVRDSAVLSDPAFSAPLKYAEGYTKSPALLFRCTMLSVGGKEVTARLKSLLERR